MNKENNLDFSEALLKIKKGHKLARKGWNGYGMWVAFTPGSTFSSEFAKEGHAAKYRAEELPYEVQIVLQPHLDFRAADGSLTVGWTPSQMDLMANDWSIVK